MTVTILDHETGKTETQTVADHDYLLILTGDCHASAQVYPKSGTHVLTIKNRRGSSFGTVNVPADSTGPAAAPAGERAACNDDGGASDAPAQRGHDRAAAAAAASGGTPSH